MHPSVAFHNNLALNWEAKYAKRSFQARVAALLSLLDGIDLSGKKWLDAGCGTGLLSRLLAERGCTVCGVDASLTMLRIARELAQKHPLSTEMIFEFVETIEKLPFQDRTFDGILCFSVIEYLDYPEICLQEFSRVLKKDGLVLVSVPNRHSLYRFVERICFYFSEKVLNHPYPVYLKFLKHMYSPSEFFGLLNGVGINAIKSTKAGSGLPEFIDSFTYFATLLFVLGAKKY